MGYVATIGMFDGVHRGHQYLVAEVCRLAHRRGLRSMVVTMHRHPREVLSMRTTPLLTTHSEKVRLLRELGIDNIKTIEFTSTMAATNAKDFMRKVLVPCDIEMLVMGYDHRFGHNGRTAQFNDYVQWGKECGIEVLQAPELADEHISSSVIRRALAEGNVTEAERLLGRRYALTGIVVRGKQIGRTICFPTANLQTDLRKMLPRNGVYATLLDGMSAMTHIGLRPTVDNDADISIETHVFDFDQDLYGREVCIEFTERIRDTLTFGSKEELKQQLLMDKERVKSKEKRVERRE